MAVKFDVRCKTCQTIREEAGGADYKKSQLYKYCREAELKLRSVVSINEAYPQFTYQRLNNHIRKHQFVSEHQLVKATTKKAINKVKAKAAEQSKHHSTRRSSALERLEEMLQQGELKGATFSAMAALLKQEADIEEKQKDRTHEMAKLLAGYIANPLPIDYRAAEWTMGDDAVEGELIEPADSTPSI